MKKHPCFILCLIATIVCLASCSSRRPSGVYDSRKMEAILYDYHIAQALANQRQDSASFYNNRYTAAVFEKHNTTREDFEHSLLWYMQNTEKLYYIYGSLNERLEEEVQKNKVVIKHMGGDTNTDTTELWSLEENYLLSNLLGANRASFMLLTDSVLEKNDQVVWNFYLDWMYHNNTSKRATAMLILTYEGDSVATFQRSLYRSGSESISMRVADRRVKSIKGFIYQESGWTDKIRLLAVTNLSLLRIHKKTAADIAKDTAAASLKNAF